MAYTASSVSSGPTRTDIRPFREHASYPLTSCDHFAKRYGISDAADWIWSTEGLSPVWWSVDEIETACRGSRPQWPETVVQVVDLQEDKRDPNATGYYGGPGYGSGTHTLRPSSYYLTPAVTSKGDLVFDIIQDRNANPNHMHTLAQAARTIDNAFQEHRRLYRSLNGPIRKLFLEGSARAGSDADVSTLHSRLTEIPAFFSKNFEGGHEVSVDSDDDLKLLGIVVNKVGKQLSVDELQICNNYARSQLGHSITREKLDGLEYMSESRKIQLLEDRLYMRREKELADNEHAGHQSQDQIPIIKVLAEVDDLGDPTLKSIIPSGSLHRLSPEVWAAFSEKKKEENLFWRAAQDAMTSADQILQSVDAKAVPEFLQSLIQSFEEDQGRLIQAKSRNTFLTDFVAINLQRLVRQLEEDSTDGTLRTEVVNANRPRLGRPKYSASIMTAIRKIHPQLTAGSSAPTADTAYVAEVCKDLMRKFENVEQTLKDNVSRVEEKLKAEYRKKELRLEATIQNRLEEVARTLKSDAQAAYTETFNELLIQDWSEMDLRVQSIESKLDSSSPPSYDSSSKSGGLSGRRFLGNR